MNSTQNKAALWKSCVEQGIFNNIPSELQHQVQGLFELTLKQFNNEGLELGIANQMVLKDFKIQLGKLIGKPIQQKSFEEVNEEYNELYAPKQPDKIEFSKEKDMPIEDLEGILKLKSEQRQNEIHEFFKEDQKVAGVLEPTQKPIVPMTTSMIFPMNKPNEIPDTIKEEIVLHRRILESILEAQLKIIDMLQRK
jgi:hypothetical protein